MSKVQILGPKSMLSEAINALHALAVVHIETTRECSDLDETYFKRMPLQRDKVEEKTELHKALEELKNLLFLLKRPLRVEPVTISRVQINEALKEAEKIEEKVRSLHAERESLVEELTGIGRYERVLRGFATLVTRLGGLKNFDIIGLTLEKNRADIITLIEGELMEITGGKYEIYTKDLDDTTKGLVLAYPSRFSFKVRSLISGEALNEIRLPDKYGDMALLDVLKNMTIRKEQIPWLIHELEKDTDEISELWFGRIEGLIKAVENTLDEIGVLSYCAQTRHAFVIEGWAPREMTGPLTDKFKEIFSDKVMVRELAVKDKETPLIPVHVHNPRIIRPFEIFLKALPTPKYGSVDPTVFIAIFFPTFFGLIVGDVAYGLIILILGLILRKVTKGKDFFQNAAYVFTICGMSAIVFGFLFGEAFGDLGERLNIMHPIVFDRVRALTTFLLLCVGIGVGHVLLGFVIGMVNHLSRGKRKEAAAKFSYLMLTISFLFTVGVMMNYLPVELKTPGLIALGIFFLLVIFFEGVIGPLEFISTLGNIISYMRIMAVGTASVVMGMVANEIGGLTGSVFLGVVIAGALHTLNIGLAILSPSIQSMRLQYVEFLSKFYEGGGREYKPFKKK